MVALKSLALAVAFMAGLLTVLSGCYAQKQKSVVQIPGTVPQEISSQKPANKFVGPAEGTRLRLELGFTFPGLKNYFMQRTLTWNGLRLAKTETTLFFGKHALTWIRDTELAHSVCELDGRSITLEDGFWRTARGRSAYAAIYKQVRAAGLEDALFSAVRANPHPSVITPILEFAIHFNPSLASKIHDFALKAGQDSVALYAMRLDVGCYDSIGYCPAEFHSCEFCNGEGGGPAGENGGGSGSRGPIYTCAEQYIDILRFCTTYKNPPNCSYCEEWTVDIDLGPDAEIEGLPKINFGPLICYPVCMYSYEQCISDAHRKYWDCVGRP